MTEQITLKKALHLVTFRQNYNTGDWYILDVNDTVYGDIWGDVKGNVEGDVKGYVLGKVSSTINGKQWQYVETPKEKLRRLIEEGADKNELIEAFDQLEDN